MTGGLATGCTVSNNQARGRGTVYLDGSGVQLLDSRVAGNRLLTYEVSGGYPCGAGGVTVAAGAQVEGCTITGNYADTTYQNASYVAGGVYLYSGAAKLLNCTVSGNTTVSGNAGGVHLYSASASVENCLIINNQSLAGLSGGVYMQAAANILNSTLYGNVAAAKTTGHGLYMTAGTAKNLILYANGVGESALTGGNLVRTGGTVSYSCVTPVTDANGAGNIEGNPRFVNAATGDFQLLFGSTCRDSGETIATLTNDLAGVSRPQGTGYDMGCYEAVPSSEPECLFTVESGARGSSPLTTVFSTLASPDTGIADYTWTTTDGVTTSSATVVTESWTNILTGYGKYDVSLTVRYTDEREAFYAEADVVRVQPQTAFVALDGGHVWPFDTLAKAATNFHEAIEAVVATIAQPGTIKVQAGHYTQANGLPVGNDHLVWVSRPVKLIGQGALATDTVIDANHTRRVLRLTAAGATVENLSLANGYNGVGPVAKGYGLEISAGTVSGCIVTNGYSPHAQSPEAMVLQSGGVVSNSDICGNRTASANPWTPTGPTVMITDGTMADCRVFDNTGRHRYGGIVTLSGVTVILSNSTVSANTHLGSEYAQNASAGVSLAGGAELIGCEVADNQIAGASYQTAAGGLNLASGNASVRTCTIRGNTTAYGYAGGVLMGANTTLANCLIVANATGVSGGVGGGVAIGSATARLLNCTLAANTNLTVATGQGLGMTAGAVTNCIVYGNGPAETRFTTNNLDFTGGTVAYTCAMPRPNGIGNLGADPRFKNLTGGDFHLRAGSPCQRAGVALAEVTDDLDGVPRKPNRPYDMGCFRVDAGGSAIILR